MTKTIELEFQGYTIGQYEVQDSVTAFDIAVLEYPNPSIAFESKSIPSVKTLNFYKLRFTYSRLRKTRTNLIHVFRFAGVVNEMSDCSCPETKFNPSKRSG